MKKYINREISWLAFNARVLQEAADDNVPIIERLKFLGIYSSNLDEFFSVRVGTLRRIIQSGAKSKYFLGGTPRQIMSQIHKVVLQKGKIFERLIVKVQQDLHKHNIFVIDETQLNKEQEEYVYNYFINKVRTRLIPIMIDKDKPFPYTKNLVLYFIIVLHHHDKKKKDSYALMEIPTDLLPRFLELPQHGEKKYLIMLDDIIRYGLQYIFSIFDCDSYEAYSIKITRDAEIDIRDDVTKSFFEKISKSLNQRKTGYPVRIAYDSKLPKKLLKFILEKMDLKKFKNLMPGGKYHNSKDYIKFPKLKTEELTYSSIKPLIHQDITPGKSIINQIAKKDILLHYPYQTFNHLIDLLREAAIDPKVKVIKMTLYRVAENSNVVNALINAIRNGKRVVVVMELQARFDEQANIFWTKKLEEAGAIVLSGIPGMKIHSKLCLIYRKEKIEHKKYCHIGTGNFNESTAKLYSDTSLFTAKNNLTNEVDKLFNFLENSYKNFVYRHLLVSPLNFRRKIYKMINNEIKRVKNGEKSTIKIKVNSISDKRMIDKLYVASKAGVKIEMIVRGICCLVPGIKGVSENIKVVSIIDKYLEHSRIYIFNNEKVYIGSADLMVRNIDNRIEVCTPIYDKKIKEELIDFFDLQFKDNVKARWQNYKMNNRYVRNKQPAVRAQVDFYSYLENKYKKKEQI